MDLNITLKVLAYAYTIYRTVIDWKY